MIGRLTASERIAEGGAFAVKRWGRRRLIRRALPFLPPGTEVRRVIGAQTRGVVVPTLIWIAVFTALWAQMGWLVFSGRFTRILWFLTPLWLLLSYGIGWLASLRVVAFRLLAVADDTVYVLDCGHNVFLWPKRLVGAVPRAPLESLAGWAGWVPVDGERLFVPRAWRRQLR